MKKNAIFKATALLLSFLLVLQISPITAWADELTASSESAPGQTGSSDTGANSDLSSQESSIFLRNQK